MHRLILNSLAYYWRINLAVSLGVAAATAVLCGALLVGDSVRGSLRDLTLDRLGKIDEVLVLDRFFRSELADQLAANPQFQAKFAQMAPAILFPHVTVERRERERTLRASSVLVLGCDERFWHFDTTGNRPKRSPGQNEIVLNETLARELGVQIGDEVTLRLPTSNQVPADSPLANKNDRLQGLPGLKVIDVISATGLGRFSMQPNQSLPSNAFVSLGTLQDALEQAQKINALFVSDKSSPQSPAHQDPARLLQPSLADFGISVQRVTRTYRPPNESERVSIDYFSITTERMIFSNDMVSVIAQEIAPMGGQPLLTYLANSITRVLPAGAASKTASIPYSMVTAADMTLGFALTDRSGQPIGQLADDDIVLNDWAADDLRADVDDTILIRYFEPETTHGQAVEREAKFKLKAIAGLTKPVRPFRRDRAAEFEQPLTAANDLDLTPTVRGVTDQETIDDWDAPFPFDYSRVRKLDEQYWDNYRTTPKAFVSLATGKRLWGSRFGDVTSFRVPARMSADELVNLLQNKLASRAADFGFQFIPIKQRQIAASSGTTPFDLLFLSLSFFVIAAALMMVALLFRLGIEQRSAEIGTFLALGFRRRRVSQLLVLEGAIVAALGAAGGILVGLGYAYLMLTGLSHWWLGAITTPFLTFHATWTSLFIGYVLGVIISAATIAWTIRQTKHISVWGLLSGQTTGIGPRIIQPGQPWASGVCFATAIVLAILATKLGGMAQAGAFVGGGAAILTGLLLWIRRRLRRAGATRPQAWFGGQVLFRLAARNAARNPGRSVMTIGLMASATFLIVALSSFRLAPTENGVGGFQLIAQSAEPIYVDLNASAPRAEFFGSRTNSLTDASIIGLRLRSGDDASCNNLYRALEPRVLGVTRRLIEHFDHRSSTRFEWSGSAAKTAAQRANPWRLLAGPAAEPNDVVPAVLDKNTAMYSLRLYRGIGEEFDFTYDGQKIRFRVAGLLSNSVLQGSLLISEADFQRRFPQVNGYRSFLIAAPTEKVAAVKQLLEDRLSDQGFDAIPARDVLEQLLAVQNTYLSTFQSLGALGLLLGTFGLATVQLRNVLERRGELALLRAAGYRRRRLAEMVLLENVLLLVGGLATGIVAALVAVLPHKLLGADAISWILLRDLAIMMAAVLIAGIISSLISVRAVLRLPLLASLRGE